VTLDEYLRLLNPELLALGDHPISYMSAWRYVAAGRLTGERCGRRWVFNPANAAEDASRIVALRGAPEARRPRHLRPQPAA
jgi:hypothetical protein